MNLKVSAAAILGVCFLASPASAKVLHSGPNGFSVSHETTVAAEPRQAFDKFLDIGGWWDKDHTFSGDARNMTIELKPGGCWCEALPDGGFVKHMEVASAAPGARIVFHGGLGPMHTMAASGAMMVTFTKSGEGTRIKLVYSVAGYDNNQFKGLAGAVDGVLAAQLARYRQAMAK